MCLFCFLTFETGSYYVTLAGLELERSAWLCLLGAEIRGVRHHTLQKGLKTGQKGANARFPIS